MKQERGDICWAEAGPIKWQRFDARFQELKSRDLNLNIPLSSLPLSLSGPALTWPQLNCAVAGLKFNLTLHRPIRAKSQKFNPSFGSDLILTSEFDFFRD